MFSLPRAFINIPPSFLHFVVMPTRICFRGLSVMISSVHILCWVLPSCLLTTFPILWVNYYWTPWNRRKLGIMMALFSIKLIYFFSLHDSLWWVFIYWEPINVVVYAALTEFELNLNGEISGYSPASVSHLYMGSGCGGSEVAWL